MNVHDEYWKFAETEQRFNTTQSGLRALASTWMLAAFGAFAVLVRTEQQVTLLFHKSLLIVFVATMASIGLFTLWIVDQIVYQRLLNSAFLAGLKMEHDNPTLPPVRALMMHAAEGVGMSRWLGLFYFLPMIAFLTISGILTFLSDRDVNSIDLGKGSENVEMLGPLIEHPVRFMYALIAFQLVLVAAMLWKRQDISIARRAELFNDSGFSELFTGGTFRAELLISRYKGFGDVPPAPESATNQPEPDARD